MRADSAMSRVTVVTTGGTIASVADDDGVLRPARTGAELVAGLGVEVVTDVVDVMNRDSSQLTVDDWDLDLIGDLWLRSTAEPTASSSPTAPTRLEETALWLELTYDGAAPVVLTGAAKSADAPDADGPANLRDAVALAGGGDGPRSGGSDLFRRCGAGTAGHAEDRAEVSTARGSPAAKSGRSSVPRRRPRRRASTWSRAIWVPTRSHSTRAWRRARAEWCSRRWVRGMPATTIVDAVRRHCAAGVAVAVSTRVPFGRGQRTLRARPGAGGCGRGGGAPAAPAAGAGVADGRAGDGLTGRRGRRPLGLTRRAAR